MARSGPFPGCARGVVFQHDALLQQGLADGVGLGPVLGGLGGGTGGDLRCNGGLVQPAGCPALQEGLRVFLQQAQGGAQGLEQPRFFGRTGARG